MRAHIQRDKEQNGLIESKTIYKGRLINLELETYKLDHGKITAEIIHHPGAVVILPIDPQGRIILVQQWRRAAREIVTELPAGTLDNDEEPLCCAKRELQEETGFAARKFTSLGGFFTAPGYCDEYLYLFLAEDLYPSQLPADDDEMIDLVTVSLSEAKKMIYENKIRDAKTVAGILRYLCVNG